MPSLKAISISIDPYESAPRLADLASTFEEILTRKALVLNGQMTRAELDMLLERLPSAGLAIRTRLSG